MSGMVTIGKILLWWYVGIYIKTRMEWNGMITSVVILKVVEIVFIRVAIILHA